MANGSDPTQTARTLADRAEIVALELRRLCSSLERAQPGDHVHAAILASDRREAAAALERLLEGFGEAYRGPASSARLQRHGVGRELGAETARAWAAGWDAWALSIDPGAVSL